MERKRIAIILYQYSVVVKGIEKKLEELDYQVDVITERFDLIESFAPRTDLFLLYLPGNIPEDRPKMRSLASICVSVNKHKSKMLILGEKKDHEDVLKNLSIVGSFGWLDRPVNNDTLKSVIEKAIQGERPTGDMQGVKKRILIVDDDPSYASMVREWIKEFYKADIVTAGMQAISFLLKNQVDLVLLDYEMPVVNGPQVLQMLRQEPATQHIPVVFLTGVGSKEQVSQVLELKPDGYILKSTTREDLLAYLKKKV